MQKSKNLKTICFLSFATWPFLLTSCSTPFPDVNVCIETDISRARCTSVISGTDIVIDDTHLYENKTYWDIRPEMILVPASSWVKIKEWIELTCHQNAGTCQSTVGSWSVITDKLSSGLDQKKAE